VAGNSGLCVSSVLEGLSCLPYSENEREIGLALMQAALKGSGVPSNSDWSAHRWLLSSLRTALISIRASTQHVSPYAFQISLHKVFTENT